MSKKKVLFFGRKMVRSGGVENYILNLASELSDEDFSIDLLITDEKKEDEGYIDDIKEIFDNVYFIPSHKENLFKHIIAVYKISKKYRHGIIHIHASDGFHAIDGIIGRLAGVRNIIYHSHNASFENGIGKTVGRLLYQISGRYYLACSKDAGRYLFGERIVTSNKFAVAKNGINEKNFKFSLQKRLSLRKEFNISEEVKLLGFVGRFSSEKNIDFIIRVFNKTLFYEPNTLLMLVGDGEEKQNIKTLIDKYDMVEKVVFTGVRKDIDYIMSALDVLLLPSHYEALGIVLIEAQTSGVKCIASSNVSSEAKISNELIYKDLSINEWVDQIISFKTLDNREYSYKNTEIAGYSLKKSANKVNKLYDTLL